MGSLVVPPGDDTLYERWLRPLLFRLSADQAHALAQLALRVPVVWTALGRQARAAGADPRLRVDLAGLPLANPVGLAPGFDKSGQLVAALAQLGFGYLVVGSITRDDLVKDQGSMLAKFLKAEIKGYRWAAQNPEPAATIAEKYIKEVPHELMTRGFKGLIELGVYGLDGGLSLEGIDRTQKLLVDLGALKRTVPAADVANASFVDAAVKDLGPAR